MAKIQPLPAAASPSPCSSSNGHQSQQAYTVWMKSLVFNGNGCTVFTPDGVVAFRVDNYGCKGGREAFFMDRAGNTLIRIRRKGFGMFRRWEVCHVAGEEEEATTPWFNVRRAEKGGAAVTMHGGAGTCYRLDGCCARKSEYRVISGRAGGAVVAEVARKQTAAGEIADFNLSNQAPDMAARLHSTRVLGTFGYHAPEYAMTGQLTQKSDVYSFGVVLLELLTGRKPVDHTMPRGQQSLVTWATPRLTEDKVKQCIDPRLNGDYPPKGVAKLAAVAALCVQYEAEFRPSMSIVVKALSPLCLNRQTPPAPAPPPALEADSQN